MPVAARLRVVCCLNRSSFIDPGQHDEPRGLLVSKVGSRVETYYAHHDLHYQGGYRIHVALGPVGIYRYRKKLGTLNEFFEVSN